jgi:acyl-CoA thioester hydrolase
MTSQQITHDQYPHWMEIEVRWGDMDAMGHVNNAVYFTYCESARIHLLRELGIEGRAEGSRRGPVLVSASCDFKQEVTYPAVLDVGVRVEAIGQRSFRLSYGMFLRGTDQLVALGASVNAWVDFAAGRAVEIPSQVREALAEYQ